jgi:hypothetical protein
MTYALSLGKDAMTQAQLLADIIHDGVSVAFIVSVLFPIIGLPHFRLWPTQWRVRIGFWPWWQSDWGWNLIAFDYCAALALLPAFLHRFFGLNPDTYLFGWIEAISIWGIPAIILWRTVMIWLSQRYERKQDDTTSGP